MDWKFQWTNELTVHLLFELTILIVLVCLILGPQYQFDHPEKTGEGETCVLLTICSEFSCSQLPTLRGIPPHI